MSAVGAPPAAPRPSSGAPRRRHTARWVAAVVLLALVVVAIVAATSFRATREIALAQGQVVRYDGHSFVFEGLRTV
ncbi:MAG TPA: hypothetical protein VGG23_05425, partial [Acidimicrobiales bacterium]